MASKARELANLGNAYSDGALSNRNLIINGAMQVAQRGTSATGVTTTDGYYTCDRWKTQTDTGTWTLSQSTDAPSGFGYSYKLQCTSAGTSNADEVNLRQDFEGQSLQQLAFGTASAKQITASFWIKTNQTGTYALNLFNIDDATGRSVTKTYTVSAADTWEYKTLTFNGDTSVGFDNDNNASLRMYFWFGAASGFTSGTVNTEWETASTDANRVNSDIPGLGGSTSDYVNITGVQLEVGDTATPFEHRSYGQELALCQRYYFHVGEDASGEYTQFGQGRAYSSSNGNAIVQFPVPMRTKPTMDTGNAVAGDWDFGLTANPTAGSVPDSFTHMTVGAAASFTSGSIFVLGANSGTGGNAQLNFDAEL